MFAGQECGSCGLNNIFGRLSLSSCGTSQRIASHPPPLSQPLYELGSFVPLHTGGAGSTRLADVYELDPVPLGRGSYGEVKSATHKKTGARRAVKSIDQHVVKRTKENFLRRELDILRHLDHPNVLRLYEAFEEGGFIYLVLELCDGGDLLERVAASSELMPEHEASRLLAQVLAALQHLHSRGVVHRDVKPENFLFTHREEREPPEKAPMKLIDFGLSRRLSFETGVLMTPKVGTAEYMAPEAFAGFVDESMADRVDMWSVGVVLHTMLTGHFPSARVLVETPATYFAKPYWTRYSEQARDLMAKLLHFHPASRLTAIAALRHPWVSRAISGAESEELCQGLPEAVALYSSFPALRRLILVAAAREIDDCDIYAVRKLFQTLELECDGVLTRAALGRCVSSDSTLGRTAMALLTAFDEVDTDGSDSIDWTELVAATLCKSGSLLHSSAPAASTHARNRSQEDEQAQQGQEDSTDAAGDDGEGAIAVSTSATSAATGAAVEDTCWRAFALLSHGNGAVSCEAPAAVASSGWSVPDKRTSRQWYLM